MLNMLNIRQVLGIGIDSNTKNVEHKKRGVANRSRNV